MKQRTRRGAFALALVLALTMGVSGCGSDSKKEAGDEKMQIVMECQHSHIRSDFEEKLEEQFPDIDVVLKYNYASNVMFSLSQTLSHGLAPDIYINEFLPNLGDDMVSEYFCDMSSQSFVNRYYLSAVESCASENGELYYLPGPSYVYGIVYDKTMFERLGLDLPTSYSEFAQLCKTIDDMGLVGYEPDPSDETKTIEVPVRAFTPTIQWPDMFQIIFDTLNYEEFFQGMKNAQWLSDYQRGEGSLQGRMEPGAQKYLKAFEDGILSLDFWDMKPFYRTQKLYQYHTSLMTIECQQGFEYNETYGKKEPYEYHEVGIMPIYTRDEPDSGYLYAIPRSYFGIVKKDDTSSQKMKAMLDIIDYLSTVEGQKNLITGPDYFGSLKSDDAADGPFYSDVAEVINGDRVIPRFFLGGKTSRGNVENYLHANTPALLKGEMTIDEWLLGADEARDNLLKTEESAVYGKAPQTLSPIEAAYVDGLAIKNSIDADLAFVRSAHNYGVVQYMFSGDITEPWIRFVSPETASIAQPVSGDMDYVVVEMTGEEILNQALASEETGMKGPVVLAGAEMELDLTKKGKEQYTSIRIDGKPLDLKQTYRVAAIRGSIPDIAPVEEYPGLCFYDMFLEYLSSVDGIITSPEMLKIVD